MSQLTFNFCEVDAVDDLDLLVNDIRVPVVPEITEHTQDIPGMVGKSFLGNSYGQKIFEIEVTIKANTSAERVDRIHELTELVMTFGDGEYPMIFSIDPEYTYYGHFTNISTPERVVRTSSWVRVILTFACSDPKGYGTYVSQDLTQNPVSIYPNGSSECYPVFTCLPKKDITKIAVTDEDGEYVFLGSDVEPGTGEALQDLEPLVFTDNCDNLALWTNVTDPTFTVENGVVRGSFYDATTSIGVSDYGANIAGKWHGPLITRWLPGSYDDYRIRVRLSNIYRYARAMGKIELYLLDTNGYQIGKIMLSDGALSKVVHAQVKLGASPNSKDIYHGPGKIYHRKNGTRTIKVKNGIKKVTSKGKTKTQQLWRNVVLQTDTDTSSFTDFYGYIELQKIGNKFKVQIVKLDNNSNPVWTKPVNVSYTDTGNQFTGNLAGIALYGAKYDIYEDIADPRVEYTENSIVLTHIQVWNIINGGNNPTKPKVIAHAGDEIKINCEDHKVYKNGAHFMDKFYIGSQFLNMTGGIYKTFAFEPGLNEADWYVEYRPTTS